MQVTHELGESGRGNRGSVSAVAVAMQNERRKAEWMAWWGTSAERPNDGTVKAWRTYQSY